MHKDYAHECIAKNGASCIPHFCLNLIGAVPIFPISKYLGNDVTLTEKLKTGKLSDDDFIEADRTRDKLLIEMRNRR